MGGGEAERDVRDGEADEPRLAVDVRPAGGGQDQGVEAEQGDRDRVDGDARLRADLDRRDAAAVELEAERVGGAERAEDDQRGERGGVEATR